MSHTPGPWHVQAQDSQGPYWVIDDNCHFICKMGSQMGTYDAGNDANNARLIAAAPELLEALKAVLASVPFASYRGDRELEECELKVRKTIAKSEGKE